MKYLGPINDTDDITSRSYVDGAGTKISNLSPITLPLDGTETIPIVQSGTTLKATALQISPVFVKALTSDATANSTTTAAKITNLDTATGTGTFVFKYYIRYVSSNTGAGVKFSVNHTGTVTTFVLNMMYVDVSAAASTGAPSQAANASTAQVLGAYSARAKSTAAGMGPTLSTDSTSDMLMVIEGLCIVTAVGDIQLYHASETATSTTVKAGTSLILTRTA